MSYYSRETRHVDEEVDTFTRRIRHNGAILDIDVEPLIAEAERVAEGRPEVYISTLQRIWDKAKRDRLKGRP